MAGQIFLDEHRFAPLRTTISFKSPTASKWTILAKLSEDNHQIPQEDVEDFGYSESYACAKFYCRREGSHHEEVAFMRIYMQVPVQGTELHPVHERAKQAVAQRNFQELDILQHFLKEKSTITPRLLAWNQGVQDSDGLVPGGYLTCLVWEKVPGISLAQDRVIPALSKSNVFWQLPYKERCKIRELFKKEYATFAKLGYVPTFPWASNLVWDMRADKLYFVGFKDCIEAVPDQEPDSMELAAWGLAVAPEDPRKETDPLSWKW